MSRIVKIESLAINPKLVDGPNRRAIENLRRAVLELVEEFKRLERKAQEARDRVSMSRRVADSRLPSRNTTKL